MRPLAQSDGHDAPGLIDELVPGEVAGHIDTDTGQARPKHFHDIRGTFCTKLILAGLSDQDAAEIMAWSPEQVAGIRRCYVDQRHVVVAIGERLRGGL